MLSPTVCRLVSQACRCYLVTQFVHIVCWRDYKPTEMNNTITEMKTTLEGINSRITEAEEQISNLEDRMVEFTAAEQKKEKRMKRNEDREELQDGGRVRCGDHLLLHKYIRNTSTCGTTLTEHLLNAGRRPQTSPKARNSPRTWVGQKKKEKQRQKNRDRGLPWWRSG